MHLRTVILRAADFWLTYELVWIGLIGLTFWIKQPANRWLVIGAALVSFAARWIARQRVWTFTPVDIGVVTLVIASLLSWLTAPYYTSPFIMITPLYGIVLYWAVVDHVRAVGRIDHVLWLIIGASVWFLVNALFGTQWDVVKSWQFAGIIERMPQVEIASTPFIFFIHPNLISMVIAYLLPLLAGVTLYAAAHRWMRVLSMLLIAAFAAVLALAQARFVIVALLTGMLVWVWFALRGRRWRSALLTLLVTLGIGEILLVSQINVPQSAPDAVAMRQRDGESMNGRLIIWQKAFTLIRAYPITGVGMNMFDSQRVRDDYPMEFWGTNRTYHAHQAYLQTWVDFGVIGLAAFGLIYAAMAAMLLSVWKTAAHGSRVLALSAAVSLLTLLAVGFVDVMVLWDRVSVVFWLTLAVGGALYSARRSPSPVTLSTQKLIKH